MNDPEDATFTFHDLIEASLFDNAPVEFLRDIIESRLPDHGIDARSLSMTITLLIARKKISMEVLNLLIESFPVLAQTNRYEAGRANFLLHVACEHNCTTDVIRRLIELNPNAVHKPGAEGMLPLHRACCSRNPSLEIIGLLLYEFPGATRIRANDYLCSIPLHTALNSGASDEIILTLLDCFPEGVNYCNVYGNLPLHSACFQGATTTLIKALIRAYPDGVRTRDEAGDFPLHSACLASKPSSEVIKMLVKLHPSAARARGHCDKLPLHVAALTAPLDAVQVLIESYPDAVGLVDGNERIPLHYACSSSGSLRRTPREPVVRLLMNSWQGEELHRGGLAVRDSFGQVPLHCAADGGASKGRVTMATLWLLLESYPEGLEVADEEGMLPLHAACLSRYKYPGNYFIRRLLIDANLLSVIQKTKDGQTPFQVAHRYTMDIESIRLFKEKQDEAVLAMKEAFQEVANDQLGLPDLVTAKIWSFAKPHLSGPTESDLAGEND